MIGISGRMTRFAPGELRARHPRQRLIREHRRESLRIARGEVKRTISSSEPGFDLQKTVRSRASAFDGRQALASIHRGIRNDILPRGDVHAAPRTLGTSFQSMCLLPSSTTQINWRRKGSCRRRHQRGRDPGTVMTVSAADLRSMLENGILALVKRQEDGG